MAGDPSDFVDRENWHGGYYELAIDLGRRADDNSDERVVAALAAMWTDPSLDGCYLDSGRRRSKQERTAPVVDDITEPRPLYGLARLPAGGHVVCVTHIIREVWSEGYVSHDWLDLSLPTAALGRVDARVGGFPFGDERSLDWREPIDSWLFEVAQRVFAAVRYRGALIGFELSGNPAIETVDDPPAERRIGYIKPSDNGLLFYPANRE